MNPGLQRRKALFAGPWKPSCPHPPDSSNFCPRKRAFLKNGRSYTKSPRISRLAGASPIALGKATEMSRQKQYASSAARTAAYRRRRKEQLEKEAAAAKPTIIQHAVALRDEIPRRMELIGCRCQRRCIFPPDPWAPEYGDVLLRLLTTLDFIEQQLDRTGVAADRPLVVGTPAKGAAATQHLESLRDALTRHRVAVGFPRGGRSFMLPGSEGSHYGFLVGRLIDTVNMVVTKLNGAGCWPVGP